MFNKNINFFLEGNYLKFLNLFKKIKGIDENYIKEIYQDLQLKFETLKEVDKNHITTVVIYSIVLNSIISRIRDINFHKAISEIKQRVKEKSDIKENQIQDEIHNLFMRNNKNISILYNISYLDTLAESFHFKKVARVCKIQISKYINRIVNLIVASTN